VQQRIDAHHVIGASPMRVRRAAQVTVDDVVAYRNERLIWACTALDLGLAADSGNPLVGAGRRVPRASVFAVFPTECKDVLTTRKQPAKEPDLFSWGQGGLRRRRRLSRSGLLKQRPQLRFDRRPLRVHFTKLLPKGRDPRLFGALIHKPVVRDSRLQSEESLDRGQF
jgi:hypothetical protein